MNNIYIYILHDHIFCVSRIIIFVTFTNHYGRFCCHCINKDFMPILIEALENGGCLEVHFLLDRVRVNKALCIPLLLTRYLLLFRSYYEIGNNGSQGSKLLCPLAILKF